MACVYVSSSRLGRFVPSKLKKPDFSRLWFFTITVENVNHKVKYVKMRKQKLGQSQKLIGIQIPHRNNSLKKRPSKNATQNHFFETRDSSYFLQKQFIVWEN